MALLRQILVLNLSYVLMSLSTGVAVGVAIGLLRGIDALSAGASPAGTAPHVSAGCHCKHCGSTVSSDSAYCERCGRPLD